VPVYPWRVVTWTTDDSFELGGTTYVCRPVGRRFASEPGRFCLLKARWEVEWYERFLRERTAQSIVEVGSYDGASSAFFAEIAHPKRLVTVDQRLETSAALTDFITRRSLTGVLSAYNGVDQGDAARLREILEEAFGAAELDLVIDDASHIVEPTRVTFNCLFPRLAAGGTYVIEDWSWAHSGLTLETWADQQPLTAFIFELILACAHQSMAISSVKVLKNYALIERGPARLDPNSFDVSECYGPRGVALIADY
jgi:Methyltransferase domain